MRFDQQADFRRDLSPRWRALGLSGKDDSLIVADKLVKERLNEKGNAVEIVDLGFVGEPAEVNAKLLNDVLDDGRIPGRGPHRGRQERETFSVNADTAAGAVAEAFKASRLPKLQTDVTTAS